MSSRCARFLAARPQGRSLGRRDRRVTRRTEKPALGAHAERPKRMGMLACSLCALLPHYITSDGGGKFRFLPSGPFASVFGRSDLTAGMETLPSVDDPFARISWVGRSRPRIHRLSNRRSSGTFIPMGKNDVNTTNGKVNYNLPNQTALVQASARPPFAEKSSLPFPMIFLIYAYDWI